MTVFELSNLLILPFWALMVLLPTWHVTRRVLASPWVVAPAAVLSLATLLPDAGKDLELHAPTYTLRSIEAPFVDEAGPQGAQARRPCDAECVQRGTDRAVIGGANVVSDPA